MCGTTSVGGGAMPPMKLSGSSTGGGDVAGAAGGGSTTALPSGGADLGAVLLQLTKSIEALVQALSGNAALGGGGSTTQTGVGDTTGGDAGTGGGEAEATGGGDPAQAAAKPEEKPEQKPARTYTVKRGDTLGKIARAHGVSVDALYELNKDVIGPDRNKIKPGQELKLPEGAKDPAQGGGNTTQGGGDRPRGNGRGNRGRGNGNGGGDRPNPGGGNGNGNGGSGEPDAPAGGDRPTGGGGPSAAERTRIRARIAELREQRAAHQRVIDNRGSINAIEHASAQIRRIDGQLRDLNSALNGRGN